VRGFESAVGFAARQQRVRAARVRQHRRQPAGGAPPGRGSLALGSLAAAPVPTSGLIERRRVVSPATAAGIFTTLK